MPNTPDAWVEIVRQKVASLRFGSVQITIHDGRVTQVEATEKTRLPDENHFTDRHQPEGKPDTASHRRSGANG